MELNNGRKELEAAIACCCMLDPAFIKKFDIELEEIKLRPARAVLAMIQELRNFDIVAAKNYLELHNPDIKFSQITEIYASQATSIHFPLYLEQLKERIVHDKKAELRAEAQKALKQGAEAAIMAANLELAERRITEKYIKSAYDGGLEQDIYEYMEKVENGIDNSSMLATNWTEFDNMHAGGLLPNELVILAARPSCGKTAAALQMALNCNEKVVIFSLEMDKRQLVARLLSAIARENTKTASRNPNALSACIKNKLLEAAPLLYASAERLRVYDDNDQTVESIRNVARKEVANGAKLVIIDYLQLICTNSTKKEMSREREVAEISRSLKNMSKELGVPVIVLAQLNRSCESEKRVPRLSDLRESGSIEQDANSVLFLHDTGKTDCRGYRIVRVILAKGRDVGVNYTDTVFNSDTQTFESYQKQEN